jgi:phosphotriesterase-related protein
MFLSQDYAVAIDWYPPAMVEQLQVAGIAGDWSMTFLFESVIPQLKQGGMTDEQLDTMLVENPKRWLGR